MTIKFNDFNNGYNNYNFVIGKNVEKEVKKDEKSSSIL